MKENNPQITQMNVLSMQVCVPDFYTDEEVVEFAEENNPCRTQNGWIIRKQGDSLLGGADERVKCDERQGYVHIMLDA